MPRHRLLDKEEEVTPFICWERRCPSQEQEWGQMPTRNPTMFSPLLSNPRDSVFSRLIVGWSRVLSGGSAQASGKENG